MAVVMVVDDEADVRLSLKTILERAGYTVTTARNGDDCMHQLDEHPPPDLLLLDIMMPGTPVGAIVKRLPSTPIIYLTGVQISEQERKRIVQRNVVDYIEKPFRVQDLLARVKKAVPP